MSPRRKMAANFYIESSSEGEDEVEKSKSKVGKRRRNEDKRRSKEGKIKSRRVATPGSQRPSASGDQSSSSSSSELEVDQSSSSSSESLNITPPSSGDSDWEEEEEKGKGKADKGKGKLDKGKGKVDKGKGKVDKAWVKRRKDKGKKTPFSRKGIPLRRNYSQEDLQEAIEAVTAGRMSLREASCTYGVPKATLCDRTKENGTSGKLGRPTELSEEEENLLVERLILLGQWGFPLTKVGLRKLVQEYLISTDRATRDQLFS